MMILKLNCSATNIIKNDLGGLGVTCSPRDPRYAGSNPAEVDGFFQDVKILSTSPPGGTLSWGPESEISGSLKNLKPEKVGLWANFNLHIHVLIPKIRGSTIDLKRLRCIVHQWPPHQNKYKYKTYNSGKSWWCPILSWFFTGSNRAKLFLVRLCEKRHVQN